MKARNNKVLNKLFGCPYNKDMTLNHRWANEFLVYINFPFPMYLAWDITKVVTRTRVNKVIAKKFEKVFNNIWSQARWLCKVKYGYDESTEFYNEKATELLHELHLDLFGGIFEFRVQRGSNNISMHSYGIACDIDPEHHAQGSKTATFPDWYVTCWTSVGFTWGKKFSKPDSMHFECKKP